MRVTVCQFPDRAEAIAEAWEALSDHTRQLGSQLLLLPEMPFHTWMFTTRRPDPEVWAGAAAAHGYWLGRLGESSADVVLGSRPALREGRRVHEAFVWTPQEGVRRGHHKHYLPDEDGTWEASWYEQGDGTFALTTAGGALIGFLMCTELWYPEHARSYATGGIHILAVPRATEAATTSKWLAAGRTAAVIAGAFCLSSNRGGSDRGWGGVGWVIDPDGEVLALTSGDEPFVTLEIPLEEAERAKSTFPRTVGG